MRQNFEKQSVESELMRQLHRAGLILSHHAEGNFSQRRFLLIVKKNGSLTQGELAKIMGIRSPTLSVLAQKLEGKGYINRDRDESDHRIIRLSITPDGEALLEKVQKEHNQILYGLFNAWTQEEKLEASRLLEKLLVSWDSIQN